MAAGQDGSDVRRRSVRKRRLWRHRGRAWTSRQRYGRLVSGCPDGAGMRSVPSGPEDFPGRCEKQGMPCAGPRSRAQAGRRAGRVQDWTQALAGPVSLLFLFQGAVSLVRGAFMERPGNSQGAALALSLPALVFVSVRFSNQRATPFVPSPFLDEAASPSCHHGHSSMHQLPDAGSLESGPLAVVHFGALDRILSLEGLAAGTPGLADRRDAEVRSPVCLHWCSCLGSRVFGQDPVLSFCEADV